MRPASTTKRLIGLTLGDPAGIGPECVLHTLRYRARKSRILVIAGEALLRRLFSQLHTKFPLNRVHDPLSDPLRKDALNFFDPGLRLPGGMTMTHIRPGRSTAVSSWLAFHNLEAAVGLARQGAVSCLVTGPVSKEGIRLAGIRDFTGHTEYLAEQDDARTVCMTFLAERCAVGLASTHLPLVRTGSILDSRDLFNKTLLLRSFGEAAFGGESRVAMLGLNPHAGENGLFGSEEKKTIIPVIRRLCRRGIPADGPYPADSFWSSHGEWKAYRIVMAMYHDQGLIPVKSGLLGRSVHVTLGLSFLRLSVDHGTAFSLAGTGRADHRPTEFALRKAEELA